MKRWFGFCMDGTVVFLGVGYSLDDMGGLPDDIDCIWVWHEESLRELIINAKEALNENF